MTYKLPEPVAWDIYVEEVQTAYLVDDLDDACDDLTNHNAVATPLFTQKQVISVSDAAYEAGKAEATEDMMLSYQVGYEKGKSELQTQLRLTEEGISNSQEQLAAAQAHIEKLRDTLSFIESGVADNGCILSAGECNDAASEALAIESSSDALREHDAKLMEMVQLTDSEVDQIRLSLPAVCHHKDSIKMTEKFIADKIRKGEF